MSIKHYKKFNRCLVIIIFHCIFICKNKREPILFFNNSLSDIVSYCGIKWAWIYSVLKIAFLGDFNKKVYLDKN